MKNIAIFASGEGTNALNIIEYFRKSGTAQVAILICNRGTAPVIQKAMLAPVPVMLITEKKEFENPRLVEFLQKQKIDLIVLAGFLALLPEGIIKAFPGKIINIHPALLPKHGGKGMYGHKVHEAVLGANEKESGISVHEVNERFDEGKILFQSKCAVDKNETVESLSKKIHTLEQEHFPKVIEALLTK